jgi:hypothetical protein
MKAAGAALLLLGLAACGQGPGHTPARNSTATAPAPSTGSIGAPNPAPDPSLESGKGPLNSFIVCPGNPRCPPDGSQPKGDQPN